MHYCMSIPEILNHICSFLSGSDLVSTALTSQGFKSFALRLLWQHLPSLSPITRNFPRPKWRTQKQRILFSTEMACLYVLVKELEPQDWGSLLPYLPMIRSICINPRIEISDAFLRSMTKSFPGQRLFPNIRSFSVFDIFATGAMLMFIQTFLGPQLQSLVIGWTSECSETIWTSFAGSIPIHSPFLKTLVFGERLDFRAISEAVCQCRYLEELTIPNPTEAALIHVSQLPELRRLTINFLPDAPLQFPSVPRPAFAELTHLNINDGTVSFHTSIQTIISSAQYQEYEGSFERTPTAKEWKDLLIQLKTAAPFGPESIIFDGCMQPEDWHMHNNEYLITPNTLQPFLTFTALTTLDMSSIYYFDLDDAFVLELAKACPEVETVDFGSSWSNHRRSRATLMAYVHLVRYCPAMNVIGLAVDASCADDISRANPTGDLPHLICSVPDEPFEFRVGDSDIEDPVKVATFLSSLVHPDSNDAVRIITAEDCPAAKATAWESVEEILPVLIAVRAQGRLNLVQD